MTYGEFGEMMNGIEMSLSGDQMLGAGGKSAYSLFVDCVLKIRENECLKKNLSENEQFNLPPETVFDSESERIWKETCDEVDKLSH